MIRCLHLGTEIRLVNGSGMIRGSNLETLITDLAVIYLYVFTVTGQSGEMEDMCVLDPLQILKS